MDYRAIEKILLMKKQALEQNISDLQNRIGACEAMINNRRQQLAQTTIATDASPGELQEYDHWGDVIRQYVDIEQRKRQGLEAELNPLKDKLKTVMVQLHHVHTLEEQAQNALMRRQENEQDGQRTNIWNLSQS